MPLTGGLEKQLLAGDNAQVITTPEGVAPFCNGSVNLTTLEILLIRHFDRPNFRGENDFSL